MKTLIISILLFSQTSLACNPVTYLQQGSTAPCTGYLFTPEKEKEVREIKLKYETLNELSSKQEELTQVLNQRVYVLSQQNNNLTEQVKEAEEETNLSRIIYFGLGALVGLGIGKALTK